MPNAFAYLALFGWPVVVVVLYLRKDALSATFWSIMGGYLLLPQTVAVDLPLIPPLDKSTIPAVSALLVARFVRGYRVPLLTDDKAVKWVLLGLLVLPFFTLIGNGAPIVREDGSFVPAYTLYDAFTASIKRYLGLLPMVLGAAVVKTNEDLARLCQLFVLAVLAYSLLILFEVRMSPQLHTWIYGFFPHSFGQQYRFGGFRAVVFLGHGLLTSILVATGFVLAMTSWRSRSISFPLPWPIVSVYLLLVLILAKSLGAILLGMIGGAAVFWLSSGLLWRGVSATALLLLGFPFVKWIGLTPSDLVVDLLGGYFPQRIESFLFRVRHEDALFAHMMDKPLFGWGTWGRNRLSDSVTDGQWIITLGMWGFAGYFLTFALPWLAIRRLANRSTAMRPGDTSAHWLMPLGYALIIAVLLVDQIPNASGNAMFWLLVGIGLGYGQTSKARSPSEPAPVSASDLRQPTRGVNTS